MRIISFCAMVCFLLKYRTNSFQRGLDFSVRRESDFSIRLTVRIIPAHEKYRHMMQHPAGTLLAQRSTQRTDSSQPPDYRTYSPKVTSLRSNLPVHRSAASGIVLPSRLLNIKRKPFKSQEIFLRFLRFFSEIFGSGFGPFFTPPQAPPARPDSGFPPPAAPG